MLTSPAGIVGFTEYCSRHTDIAGASKIVRMLNDLYTAFDVLTDEVKNPNVYKVSEVFCCVISLNKYNVVILTLASILLSILRTSIIMPQKTN